MHKAIPSFQKDICKSDHSDMETAVKTACISNTSGNLTLPGFVTLPQCLSSEHLNNTLGNIFSKILGLSELLNLKVS